MASPNNQERWRSVIGYEGIYEVSDHGRVRSLERRVYAGRGCTRSQKGAMLRPAVGDTGYMEVRLSRGGKGHIHKVHRLVLNAFQGARSREFDACHNDGNRTNNRLMNLRWDTRSQNLLDMNQHGTSPGRNKTHCPRGHKLVEPNLDGYWSKRGYRSCKACARARSWAHGRVDRDFESEADRRYRILMEGSNAESE